MHGPCSLFAALIAALLVLSFDPANAEYPDRPVTAIVPFAPGGPPTSSGASFRPSCRRHWGKASSRESRRRGRQHRDRTGGTRQAGRLHAADDFHGHRGEHRAVPEPALRSAQGLRPDLRLVNAPNVLLVRPDSGIATIADLVARAKAQPNTFSYGSPGAGTKSHLTGEQLKLRAGIDMVHVPFRGAGPRRRPCWRASCKSPPLRSPPPSR